MPWSAWQDPFDVDYPAAFQDADGDPSSTHFIYRLGSVVSSPGYADMAAAAADLAAVLAAARAPTEVAGTLSSFGETFTITGNPVSPGGADTFADATVRINQMVATFIDSGWSTDQPFPPALDSLVEGVDYGTDPVTGLVYEFEGPASRTGWLDWTLTADDEIDTETFNVAVAQSTITTAVYYDDWLSYFTFRLVDPGDLSYESIAATDTSSTALAASWPAANLGTELARLELQSTTGGPLNSDNDPFVVPLDDVGTDESFTILIQPDAMVEPPPTFHATPHPGDETSRTWQAFSSDNADPARFEPEPPRVNYHTARWRYWIPETGWHSVGGHYAPAGSVPIEINTPGKGWVAIVDGPA